jgi:excisionase family DNA binding protein
MKEVMFLASENDIQRIVTRVVAELKKGEIPIIEEQEEKLLTTNEACEFLRISKPTLHRWKKEGIVPHVRFGSNIRYKESDLMNLLKNK